MKTMRLIPLLVLAAVLVLGWAAPNAHAGGWATVELSEIPTGVSAGTPVRMELLVKQHGITPLDHLRPSVRIANGAGVVRNFPARPAGRPGWYVATVTYPAAGTWRTRLFDGFTEATPHRLAPLEVAPAGSAPAAAAAGSDALAGPWPQAIAIAVVALLAAVGWLVLAPRRYLPAP